MSQMYNPPPNMENYSPYYFDPQIEQLPQPSVNVPPVTKKKPGRKRKIKTEPLDGDPQGVNGSNGTVTIKQEQLTGTLKVRKKRDRFNGMPEEEVVLRTLPDHIAPNLDIVIVGINPGLYAAYVGHHYAGPGNHFWKCLYLAGLIPEPMTAYEDSKLLEFGIGFTNIVGRTTRGSSDLSRKEIKEGAQILAEKLRQYKPKIAVFNGKGIYEIFLGHKNFHIGKQPDLLEGTETTVYVMPSSSARCSQLPRAVDKVPFYVALKKLRDYLRGDTPTLDESEVCFPDLELKVKTDKDKEDPSTYDNEACSPQQFMPNPQADWSGYNQSGAMMGSNGNGTSAVVKQEKAFDPRDYGMMSCPPTNQNCYQGQQQGNMGYVIGYPHGSNMHGQNQQLAGPNMGAYSSCHMGVYSPNPVKMEPGTPCMYVMQQQQQHQQQQHHQQQQQHHQQQQHQQHQQQQHQQQHQQQQQQQQHTPTLHQLQPPQGYYPGQFIPNSNTIVKSEPPSFGYADCMTIADPTTGTTHIQL